MHIHRIAFYACLLVIGGTVLAQDAGQNKPAAPDAAQAPYRVGGGVSAPKVIESPPPGYSDEARKDKIEGKVVLWLIVGTDGSPRNIKVSRSLGHGLDAEAVKTVKNWKFEPAMKDGKPVPVQINIEVNFRLR